MRRTNAEAKGESTMWTQHKTKRNMLSWTERCHSDVSLWLCAMNWHGPCSDAHINIISIGNAPTSLVRDTNRPAPDALSPAPLQFGFGSSAMTTLHRLRPTLRLSRVNFFFLFFRWSCVRESAASSVHRPYAQHTWHRPVCHVILKPPFHKPRAFSVTSE